MSGHPRVRYAIVTGWFAALALVLLIPGSIAGATAAHPTPPPGTCRPYTPLHATNFGRSTRINNHFLPLTPGIQYVLEGRANTGGATLPHQVIFTITDLVKEVDGVFNLVMHDVDVSDGVKAEAELSFFAQDKTGNVWNLGEYPEEYANGQFTGAPKTWISGQQALGGVHMPANPQVGTSRYLQGYVPGIDFLDCAKVFAKHQTACVPVQCYSDVLVTDETSPLADPNAHQRKYHAPGVGIIQVGAVNDPEGETLVLIRRTQLAPHALAEVRQDSLKLERHAYQISEPYRHTGHAVRCEPADSDDRRSRDRRDDPMICP
jgi:hypothetical protein